MPFPRSVRKKALVAAARHCCVCHRYKGVKLEVHHIVQEADSGPNEFENAIVLCFDCHTDAGHYNSNHPRGTKFAPDELRQHRDQWHDIVRQHKIKAAVDPDILYYRYLLCKSFEAFCEISNGELTEVPINQPLLISNIVRAFHQQIVASHPTDYRHNQVWGSRFKNLRAYSEAYPSARTLESNSLRNTYPYFERIRVPTRDELVRYVSESDAITSLMLNENIPIDEISLALAYEEICGNNHFQEIFRVRPLWSLYLAATNSTNSPVLLSSLQGEQDFPNGVGFRPFFASRSMKSSEQKLPLAPLSPGYTMIVPLATILGPLSNFGSTVLSQQGQTLKSGQIQVLAQEDLNKALKSVAIIGPAFWPHTIGIEIDGIPQEQPIHEFDLKNLYTISRYWEMGSCPHLFAQHEYHMEYLGELFNQSPGVTQSHLIKVPVGVRSLILAELEPELTIVHSVQINGKKIFGGMKLRQGETLRVEASSGDNVEFLGYYFSDFTSHLDPWQKNDLISRFMQLQTVVK